MHTRHSGWISKDVLMNDSENPRYTARVLAFMASVLDNCGTCATALVFS